MRPVFIRLVLLLVTVPLVELVLLLLCADLFGFPVTVGFVLATGVAGAWLLRRQGLRTWGRIRGELQGGKIPSQDLLDSLLIVVAGCLMLTPGVLTDLVGIALLIPWTRSLCRLWLVQAFRGQFRWSFFSFGSRGRHDSGREDDPARVIDSYVVSGNSRPGDADTKQGPASSDAR